MFQASHVSLRIYDLMGREVDVLWNKYTAKGSYELSFDAMNPQRVTTSTVVTNNGEILSKK